MPTVKRAKLFQTGRSQAVRLPKEFRFEGKEVLIRRSGAGVVLEPVPQDWTWLHELRARLDPEVVDGLRDQPNIAERPDVAEFFRARDRQIAGE